MTPRLRLVVMANVPLPGLAKTRLIPALGRDGAARLAERFLRETVTMACGSGSGSVELCVAPDTTHPLLAELKRKYGCELAAQGDGDLGQRMARAFERALQGHDAALMIGTDAPALDVACLHAAAAALRHHDAVFVPSVDGGYALVGLSRLAPSLFTGIAWSTSAVMAQTRDALAVAGLRHAELPPVHDIDEPADLVHVPPAWLAGIDTPQP
jgi:rSAM/selenodomain-associated transferase 1